MNKQQAAGVEKLLSKQNAEKLDNMLAKGNVEQLRKHMERLFSYKETFNIHDDHLVELAESIVDMARDDDLLYWLNLTERTICTQVTKYQERKKKAQKAKMWAKMTGQANEVEMLDLTYRAWVYEEGYEHSKYKMYMMLLDIIRNVRECKK